LEDVIVKEVAECYNARMDEYERINRERMKELLSRSCKKKGDRPLFGLELEQFLTDRDTGESVGYYGPEGVESILDELRPFFDETAYSEGHLIGLSREDLAITIEPAAQFEISVSPRHEISEIDAVYEKFMAEFSPILERRNLQLQAYGYQPKNRIDDLPMIPKKRYELMYRYFESLHGLGPNMMKGTASVHFSIDYFCEENFREKYGVAYTLVPVFSFLTENSPVFEEKPYSGHLLRLKIWEATDPLRVDVLPYIRDGGMDYDHYIEFLSHAPVIVEETEEGEAYSEETMGSLMSKKIYDDAGLEHFLSIVFPMVRVKGFLEIRVADSMPYPAVHAYMLLIKGFFADLDRACRFTAHLLESNPDWYETADKKIMADGAEASFAEGNLKKIIGDVTDLALENLEGQDRADLAAYESNLKKEGKLLV
jgi:glutamate--cysteine ligase